jgi:hypothetical protein
VTRFANDREDRDLHEPGIVPVVAAAGLPGHGEGAFDPLDDPAQLVG